MQLLEVSCKKGIVWFGKMPYPKETKNTPIATNTKKKDSFFIYFLHNKYIPYNNDHNGLGKKINCTHTSFIHCLNLVNV